MATSAVAEAQKAFDGVGATMALIPKVWVDVAPVFAELTAMRAVVLALVEFVKMTFSRPDEVVVVVTSALAAQLVALHESSRRTP